MKWIAVLGIAVFALGACATVSDSTDPEFTEKPAEPEVAATTEETKVVPEVAKSEPEPPPGPVYRIESKKSYLSNGVLDTITEYIYENNLLVTERVMYADGSLAGTVLYRYDDGLLAELVKSDNTGVVESSRTYTYYPSRLLQSDSVLDTRGNPIFSYRYTYNDKDDRLTLEILSSDGLPLGLSEYRYEDGKNVRVENFNTVGQLQEYLDRTFDHTGRPVLEVITDITGLELEKKSYEYTDEYLSKRVSYVRTRKIGTEEYLFDGMGNVSTRIRFGRTGEMVERNEYTYIEVQL